MAKFGDMKWRSLGTFPKYAHGEWKRSDDVRQRLERAQELLLKYGDLLVEMEMLAK